MRSTFPYRYGLTGDGDVHIGKARYPSELSRPCQASSTQRCWLCEDVATWNDVISRFGYELWEKQTGMLCLRTIPHARGFVYEQVTQVSSTLSALLERHLCIDEGELGSCAGEQQLL